MVYAVIDTNIFVSALITHNSNASTARVLENLLLHRIIPLYNDDIIKEYDEVLHRAKCNHLYFHTPSEPPLFKGDSRDVKNKK